MHLIREHPIRKTNTNRYKVKMNKNTIIVGDFSTLYSLQWTDLSFRESTWQKRYSII